MTTNYHAAPFPRFGTVSLQSYQQGLSPLSQLSYSPSPFRAIAGGLGLRLTFSRTPNSLRWIGLYAICIATRRLYPPVGISRSCATSPASFCTTSLCERHVPVAPLPYCSWAFKRWDRTIGLLYDCRITQPSLPRSGQARLRASGSKCSTVCKWLTYLFYSRW